MHIGTAKGYSPVLEYPDPAKTGESTVTWSVLMLLTTVSKKQLDKL